MKYAKVVGEQHASDNDQRELLEIDFTKFDSVFVEGHDEEGSDRRFLLSGLLYYFAFWLYGIYGRKTQHGHRRIEQICCHFDVTFANDIDLSSWATYNSISVIGRWLILIFSIGFANYAVFGQISPVRSILVIASFQATLVDEVIALFLYFWAVQFILVELVIGPFQRDKYMLSEILSRCRKNRHHRIVVVCGDAHRPVISYQLLQEGWKVEESPTLAPFFRWITWIGMIRCQIWKAFYAKQFENPRTD